MALRVMRAFGRVFLFGALLFAPLQAGGQVVSPTSEGTGWVTATIANGASLSGAISLGPFRPVRIVVPTWTAANLTMQMSYNCTDYGNAYDDLGNEIVISVPGTGAVEIVLPYAVFVGVQCMKWRSGTASVPVNQAAERTLRIVGITP